LISCDAGHGPDVEAWRKARSAHLYRQGEIFRRQGIDIDRATLGNWVGRACRRSSG
jgi:transposase